MDRIEIDSNAFEGYSIPTQNASLLAIRGNRGMLACAYLKVETADKIGDALAIVTGVSSHSDMLEKPVVAVSRAAAQLGVKVGMSGRDALLKMA